MADVYRQMQKHLCGDASGSGGIRTYGCDCCRKNMSRNKFKKWARRQARKVLKQIPDELIGTRK